MRSIKNQPSDRDVVDILTEILLALVYTTLYCF